MTLCSILFGSGKYDMYSTYQWYEEQLQYAQRATHSHWWYITAIHQCSVLLLD